jgi:hypothetical protein
MSRENQFDEFEKRLAQQPPRKLPESWRKEILSATSASTNKRGVARPDSSPAFAELLAKLFWPHPRAWAGLAAVWVLILLLNFVAAGPANGPVSQQIAAGAPPEQLRQLLHQQEQLFAELLEEKPELALPRGDARPTRPRSERRRNFDYT